MTYGQHEHVDSFYHLKDRDITASHCRCLACFVAKRFNPNRYQEALGQTNIIYHLGKAYCAPESGLDRFRPTIEVKGKTGIVLERIAKGKTTTLNHYQSQGGYTALVKSLRMKPEQIVAELDTSLLRGRGGAGFYTGFKWRSVLSQPFEKKFVVVNADEGDPGAYIDRFILEDDPFVIIEAATIAAFALGARRGVIYLRKEYPDAATVVDAAIKEAYEARLLGKGIISPYFDFDLELKIGHGSYLCGEETALLNALEDKRPEVRARPPYPAQRGLFNAPTLVNNVETLANIPWIINHGGKAYSAFGFRTSRGTKCISLNSLFKNPGIYEVDFGISIDHIVNKIGGGLKSGELKGVLIGGPLTGIIPPELLETEFGFEELSAIGASVGHGGVIAIDDYTSIFALIHHVFAFGAFESCGKCTPCRLGTREIEEHFRENSRRKLTVQEINDIIDALKHTSLCAHGTGLADFVSSIQRYFSKEFAKCFE